MTTHPCGELFYGIKIEDCSWDWDEDLLEAELEKVGLCIIRADDSGGYEADCAIAVRESVFCSGYGEFEEITQDGDCSNNESTNDNIINTVAKLELIRQLISMELYW